MPGYFALPLLLRRFNRADDRASALVELSLVLPLLLILTAGTIELGRWFETQMQLSEALAVGLRIASQQQDLQDGICTSTVGDCGDLSSHSHLQL
ncbi:MAG: hypothetical protein DCC75_07215, partial [Proteobacteria bacterium]